MLKGQKMAQEDDPINSHFSLFLRLCVRAAVISFLPFATNKSNADDLSRFYKEPRHNYPSLFRQKPDTF